MRIPLRKIADDPLELDPVVSDVLAVPVAKERGFLESVRKTGGDESVEKVASMVARGIDALHDAYGGRLPTKLRKALADIGGVLDDEQQASVEAAKRRAQLNEDDERDEDDVLDEQQAISRANAKRNETAMAKGTNMESISDAYDRVALDWAADRVQKADPTLTRAQAIVKALEADPTLRERAQRAYEAEVEKEQTERELLAKTEQIRKADPTLTQERALAVAIERHRAQEAAIEKAESERGERRERAERELLAKAEEIRKADPSLTRERAFVAALDRHPEIAKGLE